MRGRGPRRREVRQGLRERSARANNTGATTPTSPTGSPGSGARMSSSSCVERRPLTITNTFAAMPRARSAESFIWRAAARPERARLWGAIAIAVSCGGLGVVAGRWSAQVAPTEPRTRTAALIGAVAEETRGKPAAPAGARVDRDPVQHFTPAAEANSSGGPKGGQASGGPNGRQGSGAPDPAASVQAAEGSAEAGEKSAAAPPAEVDPSTAAAFSPAAAAEAQAAARRATPHVLRSPQATTPESAQATKPEERPAAPNYQALRDYVLSR